MHEFSVMSQLVQGVLEEAKRHNASRVEEVVLDLGDFTMLGSEQLTFAFDVLIKDTIMEGAVLTVNRIPGRVRCGCGVDRQITPDADSPHRIVPVLECPGCGGLAEVVEGRECVVRNIRMVVPDA